VYLSELSDYVLAPIGTGSGLNRFNFTISKGDACSIKSDSRDDARLLLKALATLIYPTKGVYLFYGEKLDFTDYRKLLFCKREIGYIALDSAMLSNRTIRENLLFMRHYFENSLDISLDEKTKKLCRDFRIYDKLDIHASKLDRMDLRVAIAIRELTKRPKLLIVERPEDLVSHIKRGLFLKILNDMIIAKIPMVFLSYSEGLIRELANKKITIENGNFTTN
jgi:ABC-type ATPase involved in cell division